MGDSSVLFLLTPLNPSAEPAADTGLDEAAASVSVPSLQKGYPVAPQLIPTTSAEPLAAAPVLGGMELSHRPSRQPNYAVAPAPPVTPMDQLPDTTAVHEDLRV